MLVQKGVLTNEEVLEEVKAVQKVFGNRRESARPLEV